MNNSKNIRLVQGSVESSEKTEETTDKDVTTTEETTKEKPKTVKEIILNAVKEQPMISVKELAELCGLSSHGVQYHINKLKKAGVIRHVGATKAGRWEIIS